MWRPRSPEKGTIPRPRVGMKALTLDFFKTSKSLMKSYFKISDCFQGMSFVPTMTASVVTEGFASSMSGSFAETTGETDHCGAEAAERSALSDRCCDARPGGSLAVWRGRLGTRNRSCVSRVLLCWYRKYGCKFGA